MRCKFCTPGAVELYVNSRRFNILYTYSTCLMMWGCNIVCPQGSLGSFIFFPQKGWTAVESILKETGELYCLSSRKLGRCVIYPQGGCRALESILNVAVELYSLSSKSLGTCIVYPHGA